MRYAGAALVGLIAIVLAGASGYAAGSATAPDSGEAAVVTKSAYASSYSANRSKAERTSREDAKQRGRKIAKASGKRSGERAGTKAGEEQRAAVQQEEQAKAQARDCIELPVGPYAGQCLPSGPGSGAGECPPGYGPNASGGVICLPIRD